MMPSMPVNRRRINRTDTGHETAITDRNRNYNDINAAAVNAQLSPLSERKLAEYRCAKRRMDAFKTQICRGLMTLGYCRYGDDCHFAHQVEELRPRPFNPKYKTVLCRNFLADGFCIYGPQCQFIHHNPKPPSLFDLVVPTVGCQPVPMPMPKARIKTEGVGKSQHQQRQQQPTNHPKGHQAKNIHSNVVMQSCAPRPPPPVSHHCNNQCTHFVGTTPPSNSNNNNGHWKMTPPAQSPVLPSTTATAPTIYYQQQQAPPMAQPTPPNSQVYGAPFLVHLPTSTSTISAPATPILPPPLAVFNNYFNPTIANVTATYPYASTPAGLFIPFGLKELFNFASIQDGTCRLEGGGGPI